MLRACFLGVAAFLVTINCFGQIDPRATAPKGNTKNLTAEQIEAEINGAMKIANVKESLLEAAQKFFSPTSLQSKYGTLLKMVPGMLTNIKFLEAVDEWYGTRYRFGGTTKSGIDCSAFVREVYKTAFGIDLPRTAREQFKAAVHAVSDLQQGDLLFFNTRGGVSHVGVYIGNNKFVHASSSHGVVVSSLDEKYYAARYLGARRMETTDNSL